MRQAAEQELASRYPEGAARMTVRVRRVGGDVDRTAPIQLDFPQRGRTPEGLTQVQVRAQTSAGRWTKTGWALLDVAHFDSVMTVRGRIGAGEPVDASRLETAWMETTDVRGEPLRATAFRSDAAKGSLVATRILSAGRVLRQSDVRPPYTVDTGASIEMHYTRGRLAFRLSCKTREPGFTGDEIRVYCSDTRTSYRVRLTNEDTARWIETL